MYTSYGVPLDDLFSFRTFLRSFMYLGIEEIFYVRQLVKDVEVAVFSWIPREVSLFLFCGTL